jgi:hypothetical protein
LALDGMARMWATGWSESMSAAGGCGRAFPSPRKPGEVKRVCGVVVDLFRRPQQRDLKPSVECIITTKTMQKPLASSI